MTRKTKNTEKLQVEGEWILKSAGIMVVERNVCVPLRIRVLPLFQTLKIMTAMGLTVPIQRRPITIQPPALLHQSSQNRLYRCALAVLNQDDFRKIFLKLYTSHVLTAFGAS